MKRVIGRGEWTWAIGLLAMFCGLTVGEAAEAARSDGPSETLPRVDVVDSKVKGQDAAADYRSESAATTGLWGERKLQDTPYAISVLTSELIQNVGARSVDQLFKIAPLAQIGQSQDVNGIAQATLRGFNVARVYVDGIQNNNLGMGVFVEEIDRLELVGGLSGFLYGASPVGGVINYRLKRPTATARRQLTLGNYGGRQYFAHADVGGPIDRAGKFGYRINALYQDGGTAIDDQELRREMLDGSLAWRPVDGVVLTLGGATKDYRLEGRQFQFFLGGEVPRPLDGTKLYAPKETFVDVKSGEMNFGTTIKRSRRFAFRAAVQSKKDARSMVYALGSVRPDRTQYDLTLYGGKNESLSRGGYVYADAVFETATIKHTLTAGVNGYDYRNRLAVFSHGAPFFFAPTITLGLSNATAAGVTVPAWNLRDARWAVNAESSNWNAVVGDDIRVNERLSLLAGLNRSRISARSFDPVSGAAQPGARYAKTAVTPTVSVLYRPSRLVTTYATYIESLEQGTIVESTYRNAGEILKPLVSRQYELGAKAGLDTLQLQAALFQIDKSRERSNDGTPTGTYVQDGRDVHRGLELSATGRPVRDVAVITGLMFMDNEVKRSSDPRLEGRRPVWVAARTFKLHLEYTPPSLRGWVFTAGTYVSEDSYQNAANTRKVPDYALFDLGCRYRTTVFGPSTEARVNVMNVTDERYWAATTPGAPRTLAFSMTTSF